MGWFKNLKEKLNPAQTEIYDDFGEEQTTTINQYTVMQAYENFPIVNRCINLLVDSAAPITYDLKDSIPGGGSVTIKPKKLNTLLNYKPNEFQSADIFKRRLVLDLLLEGNCFIYYDGRYLYHLPATNIDIVLDKKTYIKYYTYGEQKFYTDEIIFIQDNSSRSIFRGDSRLKSILSTVNILGTMLDYHTNFFNNNAIPGLVISIPDVLSTKVKDRTIAEWSQKYRPKSGGKRPMILDGGMKLDNLGHTDQRQLDFNESISNYETTIAKALGVPEVLLTSGNNANISPNEKMFYYNTIMPICDKISGSLEAFFGYDIKPVYGNVLALKDDLKDISEYYSSLVNNGIMKGSEAREGLRLEKLDDPALDKIRIPANIAGSAVDSTQGGAPPKKEEE